MQVSRGASRAVPSGSQVSFAFLPSNDRETPASMTWNIATGVKDVELPLSFKDVPLPVPPAVIMAAKSAPAIEPIVTPRMTTRPPIALTPMLDKPRDFAKEVQEIAQMFPRPSRNRNRMRSCGLDCFRQRHLSLIKAAAKSADVPAAAKKPLSDYIERNEPLLEARCAGRRSSWMQHLWEEQTAVESYGRSAATIRNGTPWFSRGFMHTAWRQTKTH